MLGRFWPLLLWLVYFILPTDAFPDAVIGPGWTDDFLLLALVYFLFFRKGGIWNRPGRTSHSDSRSQSRTRSETHAGTSSESDRRSARSTGPRDPYQILGVDPSSDWDTIKRAYHKMANRYHPDKVSHLGEEFQQLAKEKFQEIQWAYETLAKEREARKA